MRSIIRSVGHKYAGHRPGFVDRVRSRVVITLRRTDFRDHVFAAHHHLQHDFARCSVRAVNGYLISHATHGVEREQTGEISIDIVVIGCQQREFAQTGSAINREQCVIRAANRRHTCDA